MNIKNFIIAGTILISTCNFAQKDEVKSLKKIYVKTELSASDVESYKASSTKLNLIAAIDADVSAAVFFKALVPKIELTALGVAATPAQVDGVLSPKKSIRFSKRN